ncbi:C45 family autoproteolytic acyltransferase/hydolase [Halomonas sp. M20]|uniref:C45 family autoproteolytic acyltransferase/hydolase n=1 Tax=Halomonas sp. M20 TaxID=2763264 RepID=UPI001D09C525|nr:C45 family peptidase [Halomonas sp. M20]
MSVTSLKGDRRTIGYEHGRRHALQIQDSITVYDRLFQDFVGSSWQQARHRAPRFLPAIERCFPAILDEVQGIAEGAGVDFDDILTLNCRSEISLTQASGGCSAFSLNQNGQWLAQNWDWRADQQRNVVVLEIDLEGHAPLISIGEAGMAGKIGMNANGLGVCLNAIRSQTCGEGLPIHFALRKILECPDFEAARRVVNEDRVASPAHFLIASADGQATGFEVHPGTPGELLPQRGKVLHTNHLCADTTTACINDLPRPDSPVRLTRLQQLLDQPIASEPDSLFDVLSDHANAPSSICRHTNHDLPEAERMETLFAVVMNLKKRRLCLRLGKPCEAEETLNLTLSE